MFKAALIYGMTSQEFWFGNPQDYFVYQDAFAEKKQQYYNENDVNAWMNAKYNLYAFAQVMSDSFGKKGSHKEIFPKEPFSMKDKKNRAAENKQADGKTLALKILAMAKRVGGVVL